MRRVEFVMRGKSYSLTDDAVNAAMKGQVPGAIREYAVPVNERWYSVRQVFASAIREPQGLVNTQVAARQLRRLGYPIHSVKADGTLPRLAQTEEATATAVDVDLAARALAMAVDAHRGEGKTDEEFIQSARAFLTFLMQPATPRA